MKLAIRNGYALLVIKYRIIYLPMCLVVKKIKIPEAHKLQINEDR